MKWVMSASSLDSYDKETLVSNPLGVKISSVDWSIIFEFSTKYTVSVDRIPAKVDTAESPMLRVALTWAWTGIKVGIQRPEAHLK